MDPLTRKLFQPREAREKLRSMGGIMSSSPQLASTVAKFDVGGRVDSRSGLERMEQEQETSRLMSTSPTIRALRLSEIGGNIGDFVNEVGINAIRQADALVAAGASLSGRTAAGGTAALGALASVLGFPDTGAMLERTANTLAQKRSAMMGRADGERMPFGLPAGRVFTSPEPTPFTVPQEARNLYTQAAVARRLGNTPNDSMLFAEGLPNEQLSQPYSLLPGSTGPSPMAGVTAEMPNLMQSDPRPLDRLREPSPTSPGYFSASDATLTARPSTLPVFDMLAGVPLSVGEVETAGFPTQADLDFRYGAPENEPFTGEMRVDAERQAALAAPVDAAQDLDAFLSGGVESLPTGVDAVTGFGVNLADLGIRGVGNLLERALAAGQSNAAAATAGTPPEVLTPDETTVRPQAQPDAPEDTPPGPSDVDTAPTIDVDLNDPSTYDTDFEEMMRRLGGATGKDDKSSRQKAMADLAMIGLAIAAGQSPDALTNIAQGALTGMKAIRAEDAAKDAAASETRAFAAKLATDREIARIRVPSGGGTYTPQRLYQQNLGLILANPDFYDVYGPDGSTVDPEKAKRIATQLTQQGEVATGDLTDEERQLLGGA